MTVTTTTRMGVTQWDAGTDPFTRAQLEASFASIEAKAGGFLSGLYGDMPAAAASNARFLYLATDALAIFASDGAAWTPLGGIVAMTGAARDGLVAGGKWNGRTIWNTTTARLETYKGATLTWQPTSSADLVTTAGDLLVGSAAGVLTRLALGAAYKGLAVNAAGNALTYADTLASLLTATGDLPYASAANTPARLAAGTQSRVLRMGATTPGWADMVLWVGHTWTIPAPGVPSGATNFVPGKRIRVPSGMTATLVRADHTIRGGTSVTSDVRKASSLSGLTAGTTLTGFTSLSSTTTAATVAPTGVVLVDGDYIGPVPSAVSGSPDNWTVDLLVAYQFAG